VVVLMLGEGRRGVLDWINKPATDEAEVTDTSAPTPHPPSLTSAVSGVSGERVALFVSTA